MATCLPRKILLLACGSYNPITNLHLRIFELARDHLQRDGKYEVVGGVISPTNDAYEKKGLISAKHRLEMCKLALKSSKWIKTSSWESEQSEWQRTIIAINRIQNMLTAGELGSDLDKDARVKFLCGADLLESFAVPNLWLDEDIESIVGVYGLVVISRAGTSPQQFIEHHKILTKLKDNIEIVEEWIPNEISSTKIRLSLSRGDSVRYLIPDPVVDYIASNRLYSS